VISNALMVINLGNGMIAKKMDYLMETTKKSELPRKIIEV